MEATRKIGLYESMVKRPEGVVYKLAGIEAKFITINFEGGAGNVLNPILHKKFKTFEDREAYIEKFFKGLVEGRAAKWKAEVIATKHRAI